MVLRGREERKSEEEAREKGCLIQHTRNVWPHTSTLKTIEEDADADVVFTQNTPPRGLTGTPVIPSEPERLELGG